MDRWTGARRPLLPLLLLSTSTAAWAWSPEDHRRVAGLAIPHVPPELASFLRENLDEVLRGSVDPDSTFMDSAHHSFDVDGGTGGNPRHVAYLSSALSSMIRNRAPREEVAYWFGALSHYVADIDEPLHTSDRDKLESLYHLLFEGLDRGIEARAEVLGIEIEVKVGKALSGWEFHFDGSLDPIDDVVRWQVENARWSSRFYDEIRRICTGKGGFDAGRLGEIYGTCLDEAVDDVIDLWAHVHRSAGGGELDLPSRGDVCRIEVDRKGRAAVDGRRRKGDEIRAAIARYAARSSASGGAPPSAYIEADDRCDPRRIEDLEAACRTEGIGRVSTVLATKGPWTSRLYRAVKVHVAALRRGGS